jgi:hypothetical protein
MFRCLISDEKRVTGDRCVGAGPAVIELVEMYPPIHDENMI